MKFLKHFFCASTICILGGLLCPTVSNAEADEETCTWNPDGTKVCTGEVDHDVWKDPELEETINKDADEAETTQEARVDKLEFHIFMQFLSFLDEHTTPVDGLSKYSPEAIVSSVMNTFDVFDGNNDGHLEYGEVETVLKDIDSVSNDLPSIEGIFETYKDEKLSVFEYFKLFQKMSLNWREGKETSIIGLLDPFRKLEYLPPSAAKRIIHGSAQMFIESDEDKDNLLSQDEFTTGMTRAHEKRGDQNKMDLSETQISSLFTLMDTDKDDHLTYLEFQATLPDRPKSPNEAIHEVFQNSDTNSDGALSKEEFASYLKSKAESVNQPVPTEQQIADAFEKLDEDENDSLSPSEMKGMLVGIKAAQEKRMNEAFVSFDQDRDGFLSKEELKHVVKGIEDASGQKIDVDLFLTMLDQDQDGQVSLEEMQDTLDKVMPPK